MNVSIQNAPLNIGLTPIGLDPVGAEPSQMPRHVAPYVGAGLEGPGRTQDSNVPVQDGLDEDQATRPGEMPCSDAGSDRSHLEVWLSQGSVCTDHVFS